MKGRDSPIESESSKDIKAGYIRLLVRVLLLLGICWLLLTQVLLVCRTNGNEMFPAVKDGDLTIAFRLGRDYVKNDIVVYREAGEQKIGRVWAVENDVVMMDDSGTFLVNGTEQTGEIMYPTYAKDGIAYPYTVPEGCIFVLCDYRTTGTDSRDYGAIALDDVEGRVITLLRRRGL